MNDGNKTVKPVDSEAYQGVERRSQKVWDRRIPHMPMGMGLFLRFIYKTPRRFWVLFFMACIGWIWMIAHVSIALYIRFFSPP
jgi:hypothetical protein